MLPSAPSFRKPNKYKSQPTHLAFTLSFSWSFNHYQELAFHEKYSFLFQTIWSCKPYMFQLQKIERNTSFYILDSRSIKTLEVKAHFLLITLLRILKELWRNQHIKSNESNGQLNSNSVGKVGEIGALWNCIK